MMPAGQQAREDFPRFGLPRFANRFPEHPERLALCCVVSSNPPQHIDLSTSPLQNITQQSDFHCVTTWSHTDIRWRGLSFRAFYQHHIEPQLESGETLAGATFHAQDGYCTSLPLSDLLQDDVLLATGMNGEALSVEHGAPIRLVAPNHYGYKNVKHLDTIRFHTDVPELKRGLARLMDHPRARASHEERARWLPGWLLRYLYRPMIPGTVRQFQQAMQKRDSSD